MSPKDHYQLLGVAPDASRSTIRSAYRKALRRHHPDANEGRRDGETMLLQVIAAGRILCDPQLRAAYDQQLAPHAPHSASSLTPPGVPTLESYRKILLGCQKVLLQGRIVCKRFFTAEWAKATEARAAQQRKPAPPDFNTCLYQALNRSSSQAYQCGKDGIYRKAGRPLQHERLKTWQRRTTLWLLIGLTLWRG